MTIAATQILVLFVFPAAMALAAASDLVSMTISNRLQLLLIAGFAVIALLAGFDMWMLGEHVLAFIAVLVITFFFFTQGWIGGGDAKLAACTALWFGFSQQLYEYALVSAFFGGILTIAILYARTMVLPPILAGQAWISRLHNQKEGIPYGIALAAAALAVYPKTALFALALR